MNTPLLFYDGVESVVYVRKYDEDGLRDGKRGGAG
jgi:hypothetical protein